MNWEQGSIEQPLGGGKGRAEAETLILFKKHSRSIGFYEIDPVIKIYCSYDITTPRKDRFKWEDKSEISKRLITFTTGTYISTGTLVTLKVSLPRTSLPGLVSSVAY